MADSPISYRDDAINDITKNICVYHITEEQLNDADVTLQLTQAAKGFITISQLNKRFFYVYLIIKTKTAAAAGSPIAILKENIIKTTAKVEHRIGTYPYGNNELIYVSLAGTTIAGQSGGGLYLVSNTPIPANTMLQVSGFVLANDDETITINTTPVYTTGVEFPEEEEEEEEDGEEEETGNETP